MRKLLVFIVSCFLALACEKENTPDPESQAQTLPDLDIIGQDLEAQYWYHYEGDQDSGTQVDLSSTAGFRTVYLAARQVGSLLNFFTFGDGAFSVFRLDVQTGASDWVRELYRVNDERSVIWGAVSETDFFLGNYSPRNTTNYGYQALTLPGPVGTDHSIAFRVQQVYAPLYAEGRLFLTYRDEIGHYRIAVVQTANRVLQQVLDFGPDTPSIFFDESGFLTVIRGLASGGNQLERYAPETMTVSESRPLPIDRFFAPGPLEAVLAGERLFYAFDFAQPSPVVFGPAVFDLVSNDNSILDMAGIVGGVQDALGRSIVLGEMRYFKREGVFAVGYYIDRPEAILEGGVLLIGEQGELLKRIDLPFNPTYIAKPIPIR